MSTLHTVQDILDPRGIGITILPGNRHGRVTFNDYMLSKPICDELKAAEIPHQPIGGVCILINTPLLEDGDA